MQHDTTNDGRTDRRTPHIESHALARSRANTTDSGRVAAATDGGRSDDDSPALATYTDDEYGYTVAYPADWTAERNLDGGVTFEASSQSSAGAAVFVERNGPAAVSATTFLDELDADESVHELDVLARREMALQSGQSARAVECAYRSNSHDHWRLSYLFVRDDDTGYTVGVDWTDDAFDTTANAILESFALGAK